MYEAVVSNYGESERCEADCGPVVAASGLVLAAERSDSIEASARSFPRMRIALRHPLSALQTPVRTVVAPLIVVVCLPLPYRPSASPVLPPLGTATPIVWTRPT